MLQTLRSKFQNVPLISKLKNLKKISFSISNCSYYLRPQYQWVQKWFSLIFLLHDMFNIFQLKSEIPLAKYISNSTDEALCSYSKSDRMNNVLHLIWSWDFDQSSHEMSNLWSIYPQRSHHPPDSFRFFMWRLRHGHRHCLFQKPLTIWEKRM